MDVGSSKTTKQFSINVVSIDSLKLRGNFLTQIGSQRVTHA